MNKFKEMFTEGSGNSAKALEKELKKRIKKDGYVHIENADGLEISIHDIENGWAVGMDNLDRDYEIDLSKDKFTILEVSKKYSQAKFKKFAKDLKIVKQDLEADFGGRVDDSIAYEIAGNLLRDESGLKEFLAANMGITDAQGWIADRL